MALWTYNVTCTDQLGLSFETECLWTWSANLHSRVNIENLLHNFSEQGAALLLADSETLDGLQLAATPRHHSPSCAPGLRTGMLGLSNKEQCTMKILLA